MAIVFHDRTVIFRTDARRLIFKNTALDPEKFIILRLAIDDAFRGVDDCIPAAVVTPANNIARVERRNKDNCFYYYCNTIDQEANQQHYNRGDSCLT